MGTLRGGLKDGQPWIELDGVPLPELSAVAVLGGELGPVVGRVSVSRSSGRLMLSIYVARQQTTISVDGRMDVQAADDARPPYYPPPEARALLRGAPDDASIVAAATDPALAELLALYVELNPAEVEDRSTMRPATIPDPGDATGEQNTATPGTDAGLLDATPATPRTSDAPAPGAEGSPASSAEQLAGAGEPGSSPEIAPPVDNPAIEGSAVPKPKGGRPARKGK